ncbi:RNA polymerase sigma factor [Kutzneria kofuensis]|uniref:RNA polymerase sigma factor (Sigma-70 family) n=1 Tax=Kutzneria kofuensis TaxID=103725 RepID=A0A7W9KFR0_9PSEU|nr:sigma-70 family RNA polymerase sigma factor [Kutzneria kofuensis]MBB5891795.1 RNA polymerase sigma factor (sigma-70 family) [Kutzneria kofuensis]
MSDVGDLVVRARRGEQAAWDEIVERFAPLVWAVCNRHNLSAADTDDVNATVWLRLVERLNTLREPAALPGWIATTTRNECLHLLRDKKKQVSVDDIDGPDERPELDAWLLVQERHIALRVAFRELSERCRRLLGLLFAEETVRYATISAQVGLPVGSIGPSRMRCLDALRRNPALAPFEETS